MDTDWPLNDAHATPCGHRPDPACCSRLAAHHYHQIVELSASYVVPWAARTTCG